MFRGLRSDISSKRYLASTLGLSLALFLSACVAKLGPVDESPRESRLSRASRAKGRVAASGSRNRFTAFEFDVLGRAIRVHEVLEGAAFVYSTRYGYVGGPSSKGELGQVAISTTFPDHERVSSFFDASGRIQRITSNWGNEEELVAGRTRLNTFGQVESTEAGDQTITLRTYNAQRQPLHVVTKKMGSNHVLQARACRYDKTGRVTQINDFCSPSELGLSCCDPREASCTEGALSASFEYGATGALTNRVTKEESHPFAIDAIGNLIRKNNALQVYADPDHPHALTSVHDQTGRQLARYVYNPVGATTLLEEDGLTTSFVWNALNMPVRTEKHGQSTQRFYVGESLYKRIDVENGRAATTLFLPHLRIEDGTYRKFYGTLAEREATPAASGDASTRRGKLRFYHRDHLGSATLVTDAEGNPLSRNTFLPFGETLFSEGNFTAKKQFSSKEREIVSGLYDFGARLYNPRTGRFLSADSVVDGLDPYAYVYNNPLNFIDPSGHQGKDISRICQTPGNICDEITITAKRSFWDKFKQWAQRVVSSSFEQSDHSWDSKLVGSRVDLSGAGRQANQVIHLGSEAHRIIRSGTVDERLNLASVASGAVPYIGDYCSLGISFAIFCREPSLSNGTNVGLDFMGAVLPLAPAMGTLNRVASRSGESVEAIIDSAVHAHGDVVELYKAPRPKISNPADELVNGFSPANYSQGPNSGPYFTTDDWVAHVRYQQHYENGLQIVRLPRPVFEDLLSKGILAVDKLEHNSYRVTKLKEFNHAMRQGPPNQYIPERR